MAILKKVLIGVAAIAVLLLLLVVGLLEWPLSETPRVGVAGNFLIRNVAVVDVETLTTREGQDVVVNDGRITSVGQAQQSPANESLITIDVTGVAYLGSRDSAPSRQRTPSPR